MRRDLETTTPAYLFDPRCSIHVTPRHINIPPQLKVAFRVPLPMLSSIQGGVETVPSPRHSHVSEGDS